MGQSESFSTKATERAAGSAISVSFVAAMLSLLLFAWLAEEVLEADTIRFDNFVRSAVHGWASPGLTSFMRTITWIGSVQFLVPFVAVCVAAFLYVRWRRGVFLLLITVAGAIPLDAALKVAFHRARPLPFFDIRAPQSYSFPSGHALFAFCIFGVLAAITTARTKRVWLRVGIWVVAGAMVFLIGLSRIYLGVHYPSDVVAGYLAAAIWVSTIAVVDRWRRRRASERDMRV